MTTNKVKYFTRDTLILANNVAVATKRNRSLYEDKLESLHLKLLARGAR